MESLDNKTVVITGASAGIGRAVARQMATHRARIALLSRNEKRLKGVVSEVKARGGSALMIPVDMSRAKAIQSAAQSIEDTLGPIDIWINNAMVTVFREVKDTSSEEFKRVTEVTYLGTVYGTRAALTYMWPRNSGKIIQVGSALAYRAIPLQAPYCAAKHAVRGFTDSLRTEILHHKKNIHLTSVHLPGMNTPQFSWARRKVDKHPQPVPPIYAPEVAARAIVWAAIHTRREVWVGTPTVTTIMQNHLVPEILDRYLARTAYTSQFAEDKTGEKQEGNLYEPVEGDYETEGIFTNKQIKSSTQFLFEQIPVLHYVSNIIVTIIYSFKLGWGWIVK